VQAGLELAYTVALRQFQERRHEPRHSSAATGVANNGITQADGNLRRA